MMHTSPLISTIASALGLALVFGFLAARFKIPSIVGYLLAGIIIGPFTPGFVADTEIASQLAEIGVMLLMFGVGLHFSLADLLSVRKIAIPGAVLQIAASTLLGTCLALAWGWSWGSALVFGLALSVASTVVLLRALEALGALESMNGHITVGWVIVQDLAMVLVLVLLPAFADLFTRPGAEHEALWPALALTLTKVAAFIILMLVVGRKAFPWVLWQVTRTGSRELFTLCVIAAAVSVAFGAAMLFGVSFALGAFFAGVMMRESEFSHRAAEESLPLRDAFAVLFFVSVGMQFDPTILLTQPVQVLGVLCVILIGTPVAAALLVLAFRFPLNTALTVAASLSQIGEFSFILGSLGVSFGLLPPQGQSLILAGALLSISLNPLVFKALKPFQTWISRRSSLARKLERPVDPLAALPMSTTEEFLSGQIVLVGYGRVGQRIGAVLSARNIPYVVIDQNRETIERLRKEGLAAVCGDAAEPSVLIQAHIARASMLVIATPDTFNVRQVHSNARLLNPKVETVVRTHSEEEAALLEKEGVEKIFYVEAELAKGISQHALKRFGRKP
jgi:CPA2 family monovalent cation:H+ antiporter-2